MSFFTIMRNSTTHQKRNTFASNILAYLIFNYVHVIKINIHLLVDILAIYKLIKIPAILGTEMYYP